MTLWNPMDCSMTGFPVHHQLLELTQTHVHRVGDAFQPSHPLSSPSPEKQKCLTYSYQPQGDHVLIQIWTNKQLCNKKITTASWSVYSEIHYSEILIISPTFSSSWYQGVFTLLYQDGKQTTYRRSFLSLLLAVWSSNLTAEWEDERWG